MEPPFDFNPKLKALCLVNELPDEALPELLETLQQMSEFYKLRKLQPDSAIQSGTVSAKFGKIYTRPEFHIENE